MGRSHTAVVLGEGEAIIRAHAMLVEGGTSPAWILAFLESLRLRAQAA